jgi:glycosyltransferase involved in cell wall biosynthesis
VTPAVSVLLPAHDEERLIERAVRSVLQGDLQDVEVVVCLDHCTDDTAGVLRRLGDPRVVCVVNDGTPGIGPALNVALRAARADVVARLDADDAQSPDRLPRQLEHLARHRLDLCLAWARLVDAAGRELLLQTSPLESEGIRRGLRRANVIVHSTVLMRREALHRAGGYRSTRWEDYDLWVRLSRLGCRFGGVPAVVVTRTHRVDGWGHSNGLRLEGRLDILRHRVRAAWAMGTLTPW